MAFFQSWNQCLDPVTSSQSPRGLVHLTARRFRFDWGSPFNGRPAFRAFHGAPTNRIHSFCHIVRGFIDAFLQS